MSTGECVYARRSVVAPLAALLLLSCGNWESSISRNGEPPIVRLSALRREAVDLLLDPEPRVVIGGLRADIADEFNHRNGLLRATVLSDSGLAVIDDFRVRIFSRTGEQLAAVGSPGAGPGEIGLLSQACRTRGDTVVAYDVTQRRISIVAAGVLVRQLPVVEIGALPRSGCFDDGTFILHRGDAVREGVQTGVAARLRTDGTIVNSLGEFPARTPASVVTLAAHGSHFWLADPRSARLTKYDTLGVARLVVELAETPEKMSPRDVEMSSPNSLKRGSPQSGAGLQSRSAEAPNWPFFDRVLAAGDDVLWIQDAVRDFRAPTTWVKVGTDGSVLGRLTINPVPGSTDIPEVVAFVDAGVWLLRRDQDGVATFGWFAIHAAPSPP